MNKRFADLTPLQALRAAIAIERRNTELYQNLAQTFASYDGKLGEVFAAMAEEEISHRIELEAFLQQQFPGEHATVEGGVDIDEVVEAPDLDEPEAFIFDNVSVEQAIDMAERAEARACNFYQTMVKEVSDSELRALCEHMAAVEAQHRETLTRWKTPEGMATRRPITPEYSGGKP